MKSLDLFMNLHLAPLGWTAETVIRLGLAAVAGGIVGAEREVRGREAGFRTHILICVASALVVIVSIDLTRMNWSPGQGVHVSVDLIRIAYAVMTGIGFLGAGAILQARGSVRGLTTAAAMWSVAAVGLAAGFGLYMLTFVSTALIVMTLWAFNYVGDFLPRRRYRIVKLRAAWTAKAVSDALALFEKSNVEVVEHSFERLGDLTNVEIEVRVVFSKVGHYRLVEERLKSIEHVQLVAANVA